MSIGGSGVKRGDAKGWTWMDRIAYVVDDVRRCRQGGVLNSISCTEHVCMGVFDGQQTMCGVKTQLYDFD